MKRITAISLSFILLIIVSSCQMSPDTVKNYMVVTWKNSMKDYSADIVFMGDSISFLADFNTAFASTGKKISNTATGGDRIQDQKRKCMLLDTLEPETVLLMIGINNHTMTLDAFEKEYAELLALFDSRTKANGGSIGKVYVESILPVGTRLRGRVWINEWVHGANEIIERLAASYPWAVFLNVHPYFEDRDGYLSDCYTTDYLHLDTKGLQHWYSVLSSMVPELSLIAYRPADMTFIGDSISALADFPTAFPEKKTTSVAISGHRIQDQLERIPELDALKPESVFVMIGTNNFGLDMSSFRTLYKELLDELHERREEGKAEGNRYIRTVYVETIIPVARDFPYSPEERKVWIREANAVIRELSALYPEVVLIDTYSEFDDGDGYISRSYAPDGIHLQGEGLQKWYGILQSAFASRMAE